jgi:hypothetical protein
MPRSWGKLIQRAVLTHSISYLIFREYSICFFNSQSAHLIFYIYTTWRFVKNQAPYEILEKCAIHKGHIAHAEARRHQYNHFKIYITLKTSRNAPYVKDNLGHLARAEQVLAACPPSCPRILSESCSGPPKSSVIGEFYVGFLGILESSQIQRSSRN